MKIGILGDVHGNGQWFEFAMWKFAKEGINRVLQVGDFGIGQAHYSNLFLKRANRTAKNYGIRVYITPGNHEDWDYINELHAGGNVNEEGFTILRQKNLLMADRGFRWEWDGVKFVSLGGAPSVDRAWRVKQQGGMFATQRDRLWYEKEMITQADVDKVVAGGYADVMVTHDAPRNVPTIDNMIKFNPHGFKAEDLVYAAEGRELLDQAFRGVSPRTVLHGHYHTRVNDLIPRGTTEDGELAWSAIIGMGADFGDHSLGHYDTEERVAAHWSVMRDLGTFHRTK